MSFQSCWHVPVHPRELHERAVHGPRAGDPADAGPAHVRPGNPDKKRLPYHSVDIEQSFKCKNSKIVNFFILTNQFARVTTFTPEKNLFLKDVGFLAL